MADSVTTKIWEKHFGNAAAVPFGQGVVPFFNELSDHEEQSRCQDISDRQAFGLASDEEIQQAAAMRESFRLRNGREMVVLHRSRD